MILDTNVISEVMNINPDSNVKQWIDAQPNLRLFITAVTEAEIRYGLALLAPGQRRNNLTASVDFLLQQFAGRILSFDSSAAGCYAEIVAGRKRIGRPISVLDAQIAAIAKKANFPLATRNTADFDHCGIILINPWIA